MVKRLGLVALGLLATMMVLGMVIPLLVDGNKFKNQAVQQLSNISGHPVFIKGDLSVRLFPHIEIRAGDVYVQRAPGQLHAPLVHVESLDIGVALFPLFANQVVVRSLHLVRPKVDMDSTLSRAAGTPPPPAGFDVPQKEVPVSQVAMPINPPRLLVLQDLRIEDGSFHYKNLAKQQAIKLDALNLTAGMDSGQAPLALSGTGRLGGEAIELTLKVESLAGIQKNELSAVTVSVDSAPLKLEFKGEASQSALSGDLEFSTPSAMRVMPWISGKSDKVDGRVFPVALRGALQCTESLCQLSKAVLKADHQELKGDASVQFGKKKPVLNAALQADTLDISPYLQQKQAAFHVISPAYAEAAPWSDAKLDLSAMAAMDGNVLLAADTFRAGAFEAQQVHLDLALADATLTAKVQSGALYQGTGLIHLNVTTQGHVQSKVTLAGLQLKPLLAALNGYEKLSGALTTNMTLRTSGFSQRQMVSNLAGDGQVRVRDGSLKGYDVAGLLRDIKSTLQTIDTSPRSTDFTEAGGTFSITNGVISNQDFAMKSPLLRIGGKGAVNLPAYTIDYLVSPELVETATGQGGKDKAGLGVPIRISGALDHPSYTPDFAAAAGNALKNPEAIGKTIQDHIGGAKDLLKDGKSLLKMF